MAASKNPLVRVLVPIGLLAVGVAIFFAVVRNTTNAGAGSGGGSTSGAAAQPAASNPPAAVSGAAETGTPAAPANAAAPVGAAPVAAAGAYVIEPVDQTGEPAAIGSLDEQSKYQMEVRFTRFGAGVASIRMTHSRQSAAAGAPNDEIQTLGKRPFQTATGGTGVQLLAPMGALQVVINGQGVPLFGDERTWRETGPGQFEAFVRESGDGGRRVARVTRTYKLEPERFDLTIQQQVENLSGQPMSVVWQQYGPMDLPRGKVGYGGDTRRVRFGYMLSPKGDPGQQFVDSARFLIPHSDAAGSPTDATRLAWPEKTLWPNARSTGDGLTLVWAATTNRYFATAIYPSTVPTLAGAAGKGPLYDKRFQLAATISRYVVNIGVDAAGHPEDAVILGLTSPTMTLGAGQVADVSHGVYAGPLSKAIIEQQPAGSAPGAGPSLKTLGLDKLVIYTFGGPCAFCTFQWLTGLLRAFLGFLHDNVLFDWSLAIIVLVLCVRAMLHPITKWSQTNIMRFSKQMSAIAPKQKALQEKYKGDPAKMREEMARLMREENISYGGALGCLPMLLQTPIWIALFAMLYFTYELRHQPAFFGAFQAMTGSKWAFMSDLAEPDHFISFGKSFTVPLLSSIMGPIESINLLPILLGVLFFIQQKYLTPPPATTLTPEQESQQKMMKVMTVVMFPLFMYNVPSGLALYTMTNSALGIVESRYIRAHADKLDRIRAERIKQSGGKAPPSFMQRMQERVAERQKLIADAKGRKPKGK